MKFLTALLIFFLTSSLAVAETATFKNLENNLYDVQELTKIGADYEAFSKHVTELGLALGRYKREMNGQESIAYEALIVKAAENYITALDSWRRSFKTYPAAYKSEGELLTRSSITLRDFDIKQAAKKISEAEALKKLP